MDQRTIKIIKLANMLEKTTSKNETNADKKKMREEKGKRDSITRRMLFPVKKMTCVISHVFSRKETLASDKKGGHRDHDETLLKDQTKQKPLRKKKESFWESARIRLKILILGQRLKPRRRSLSEGMGEEEELCKKRILMGERCKPINKSGVLHYDAHGIILPEP